VEAFTADPGFDRLYGLEIVELTDDHARGRVPVRDDLKQSPGVVHSGVYSALAAGLASLATGQAVAGEGKVAIPLTNHASIVHPIREGTIEAVAIRRHRGRTTWVWQVEISDERAQLCVLSRVTLAIELAPDHLGAPRPSQ
jgi:1,4-dihydroxy-2-naphthoyl-CoA hydrolase